MRKEIKLWQIWWIITDLGILLIAICKWCGMSMN